jgi:hypothetical protein
MGRRRTERAVGALDLEARLTGLGFPAEWQAVA